MASKSSSKHKTEKYKGYAAAKTSEKNTARRMVRDAKRSENWEEVLKKNLDYNKNPDVRKFAGHFIGKAI